MTIEKIEGGGFIVSGEHIPLAQMLAQRGALKLEIKGLKMSRGISVFSIIKRQYGLKGSKETVLTKFEKLIQEKFPGALQEKRHEPERVGTPQKPNGEVHQPPIQDGTKPGGGSPTQP